MRLLNVHTLELEEFLTSATPEYAILSHTWGDDEVSFQDVQRQDSPPADERAGFPKIAYSCTQAAKDALGYIWIDTCCIDKTSSAELSEAINSMYELYAGATKCYAYLADVPGEHGSIPWDQEPTREFLGGAFANSRWWTRGWTLQELIAPKEVIFYGSTWRFLTTKHEMASVISAITGIDCPILEDARDTRLELDDICVARKLSWAARRQTSKIEDQAYCLLGLFKVNMPLLYGEGAAAFTRFQEELMKQSNDTSLFAWEGDIGTMDGSLIHYHSSMLAPSPAYFEQGNRIHRWPQPRSAEAYTITKKGLHITLPALYLRKGYWLATLGCRYDDCPPGSLAITVKENADGTSEVLHLSTRLRTVEYSVERKAKNRSFFIAMARETQGRSVPPGVGHTACYLRIHQGPGPLLSIADPPSRPGTWIRTHQSGVVRDRSGWASDVYILSIDPELWALRSFKEGFCLDVGSETFDIVCGWWSRQERVNGPVQLSGGSVELEGEDRPYAAASRKFRLGQWERVSVRLRFKTVYGESFVVVDVSVKSHHPRELLRRVGGHLGACFHRRGDTRNSLLPLWLK